MGKDEEALAEFSQALELDSKMYRSLFAKTMLSPLSHPASIADRKTLESDLNKVLDINPQFAPAYIELAKSEAAQGDLNRALSFAQTAEKLEPARAGYHVLTGEILLRSGHPADAAKFAAYVADRWGSPDHDEAMELWNRVPPDRRPAEAPTDAPSPDVRSAEGIVKSVSCDPNLLTLTLDHAGQPLVFKIKNALGGFSDTLWFGRDHFTPCYHVIGLRAVVRYKSGADKSMVGDVVSWGYRDDLPPAPAASMPAADAN